ncbi:MAG: hypothetical protein IIC93_09390 [Chloroflexi bacterium]|nr:hypothetical protein [Chloroflexota bacterium]
MVAPTVIATVLFLSLVFIQFQSWRSAKAAIPPGANTRISIQSEINDLGIFRPLSTLSRSRFIALVTGLWENIAEDERGAVLEMAEKQIETLTRDEPENMKIRLIISQFYRVAASAISSRSGELLEKAREHANEATEIGPHIFESLRNGVEQAFAEGDLPTIELAVAQWNDAGWTEKNSRLFDARLEEAQAAAQ